MAAKVSRKPCSFLFEVLLPAPLQRKGSRAQIHPNHSRLRWLQNSAHNFPKRSLNRPLEHPKCNRNRLKVIKIWDRVRRHFAQRVHAKKDPQNGLGFYGQIGFNVKEAFQHANRFQVRSRWMQKWTWIEKQASIKQGEPVFTFQIAGNDALIPNDKGHPCINRGWKEVCFSWD